MCALHHQRYNNEDLQPHDKLLYLHGSRSIDTLLFMIFGTKLKVQHGCNVAINANQCQANPLNGSPAVRRQLCTPVPGCTARAHRWYCGYRCTCNALSSLCLWTKYLPPIQTHTCNMILFYNLHKIVRNISLCTYRTVLPVLVIASALTERHALVSTEDETRVADTSFHARMFARATRAHRILTSGLATSGCTWVVVTAREAFPGLKSTYILDIFVASFFKKKDKTMTWISSGNFLSWLFF